MVKLNGEDEKTPKDWAATVRCFGSAFEMSSNQFKLVESAV